MKSEIISAGKRALGLAMAAAALIVAFEASAQTREWRSG